VAGFSSAVDSVGYGAGVAMQIILFPAFGIEIGIGDNLAIGLVFTGVSIIRSYALRRVFEGTRRA